MWILLGGVSDSVKNQWGLLGGSLTVKNQWLGKQVVDLHTYAHARGNLFFCVGNTVGTDNILIYYKANNQL